MEKVRQQTIIYVDKIIDNATIIQLNGDALLAMPHNRFNQIATQQLILCAISNEIN